MSNQCHCQGGWMCPSCVEALEPNEPSLNGVLDNMVIEYSSKYDWHLAKIAYVICIDMDPADERLSEEHSEAMKVEIAKELLEGLRELVK